MNKYTKKATFVAFFYAVTYNKTGVKNNI